MELVVYLKDDSDLAIIENLLNRLKLRFEKRNNGHIQAPKNDNDFQKNLKELRHLAAQIDQSSFGDPVEWQREERKDRPLPFRH
jgi:hypothetical protein